MNPQFTRHDTERTRWEQYDILSQFGSFPRIIQTAPLNAGVAYSPQARLFLRPTLMYHRVFLYANSDATLLFVGELEWLHNQNTVFRIPFAAAEYTGSVSPEVFGMNPTNVAAPGVQDMLLLRAGTSNLSIRGQPYIIRADEVRVNTINTTGAGDIRVALAVLSQIDAF